MGGTGGEPREGRIPRADRMILVITGTEKFPFNRLIRQIDKRPEGRSEDEQIFVQIGSSTYTPSTCEWDRLIPFSKLISKMKAADLVVAHGGAGTALLCLHLGKRPILMPRVCRLGEHIDDHQVLFVQRLKTLGLVSCVMEGEDLWETIKEEQYRPTYNFHRPSAAQLTSFLDDLVIECSEERRP